AAGAGARAGRVAVARPARVPHRRAGTAPPHAGEVLAEPGGTRPARQPDPARRRAAPARRAGAGGPDGPRARRRPILGRVAGRVAEEVRRAGGVRRGRRVRRAGSVSDRRITTVAHAPGSPFTPPARPAITSRRATSRRA